MKTDGCRETRESLGAYALGHLSEQERLGVEAHLEGCASCRAELEQLTGVVHPLSLADPARFESAPQLPATLGAKVAASIARERLGRRRRRLGFGLALGGAAAAVATALVLLVLPGGDEAGGPEKIVTFASAPKGTKISAKLIPNAFGTEIHMYVKGVSSGTLCRVYLHGRDGTRFSAGSFRYRWGDGSYPILSSALDLSKTDTLELRIGDRSFSAPVGGSGAA
jgi:hypothetical protein